MITELTKEQEAKFPEYVEKWTNIGLAVNKTDRAKAEDCLKRAYQAAGLEPPRHIVWAQSPVGCLDNYARDYEEMLKEEGKTATSAEVNKHVSEQAGNFCYGNHDAAFLSFYDFFLRECKVEACKKLLPLIELAECCGWWLPYKYACYPSDMPTALHREGNLLHKDGGPALAFADGFAVYALHGVLVSKTLAETPAEKLDAHLLVKEKNAEIRREIGRKIGMERIIRDLNATVIDKDVRSDKQYELLELDLGDERRRPYLKMESSSIPGVFHVEGVPPGTKTVKEALVWRNKTELEPTVLT